MIEKTTLFIGLNDKDSKQQHFTELEASKIVSKILIKNGLDCTISEAMGVYTHDDNSVVIEKSLRVELLFCDKARILPVIPAIKTVLNQESIAVQFEQIDSELL